MNSTAAVAAEPSSSPADETLITQTPTEQISPSDAATPIFTASETIPAATATPALDWATPYMQALHSSGFVTNGDSTYYDATMIALADLTQDGIPELIVYGSSDASATYVLTTDGQKAYPLSDHHFHANEPYLVDNGISLHFHNFDGPGGATSEHRFTYPSTVGVMDYSALPAMVTDETLVYTEERVEFDPRAYDPITNEELPDADAFYAEMESHLSEPNWIDVYETDLKSLTVDTLRNAYGEGGA